jgi:hypothetical protein
MIVTPQAVEKRLVELSKEIDESQRFLEQTEAEYYTAKAECEISLAEARLRTKTASIKYTVQDREDLATTECASQIRTLAIAEAKVRAARGNANRVRTQVDIARSIGTSVRSALDL